MNNGNAMRLTSAILFLIIVGLFSGCASTGDNKDTSSGEYDVFLESDKGEAVRPPLTDKKAAERALAAAGGARGGNAGTGAAGAGSIEGKQN